MANRTAYRFRSSLRTFHDVTLIGLMTMSLLVWGCSKPEPREAKSVDAPQPPATEVNTRSGAQTDEALPPIVKTAWKGDLDQILQRRVVRVLVPFRRPEFFYLDGRPVGIL